MAFDKTKPTDSGLLINAPGQIRANWDALETGTTASLLVTNAKVASNADITEGKLLFTGTGHGHTGGAGGKTIDLATAITGTLPIANGGTAIGSYTHGDILYVNSSGNLAKLAAGVTDKALITKGAGVDPEWGYPFGITAFIDDDSMATASATNVCSGESVKDYVDTQTTVSYTADGDSSIASALIERSTVSSTYNKIKEITLLGSGTLTFKWSHKCNHGGSAYTRIYRNGGAVGTQKSTGESTYQAVEDTVAGWSNGDLIQLYIRSSIEGTDGAYAQSFKVYGTTCTIDTD